MNRQKVLHMYPNPIPLLLVWSFDRSEVAYPARVNWVPCYNNNSHKTLLLVLNSNEEKKESWVGGWGQRGRWLQGSANFSVRGCHTGWTTVATKMSGEKPGTTCVTLIPEQRLGLQVQCPACLSKSSSVSP